MSGKGDTYRPVDGEKYRTNWPLGLSPQEKALQQKAQKDKWLVRHWLKRSSQEDDLYGPHLRHRPEPDTLPPHTQEGHGESDPAERKEIR